MLKPVSIFALDGAAASLAAATRQRIAATIGLEDLVQVRALSGGRWVEEVPDGKSAAALPPLSALADAIESVHERRQAPGSPLRNRDDISNRELVLIALSAAGPGRALMLELARQVRQLFSMRLSREFYTVEVLCLLPDLFAATVADDYGAAYSLLKLASAAMAEEPQSGAMKPLDAVWLVSSTNAQRVKFGKIEQSSEAYVEAMAGLLTLEPELSGALPGAFRPRSMDATFSSFGYAELLFPRDITVRRIEARLAAELVREKLLAASDKGIATARIDAKQFVVRDDFAVPMSRIGVEAGQSLFRAFRPKTLVTEKTRNAEEVITAVRAERKAHHETTHIKNLHGLAVQGEQTTKQFADLLAGVVDETIDTKGYPAAIRLLEAMLDPTPDIRSETGVAPRNLVTEINAATAVLDQRLKFTPGTSASDTKRKRIRDIDTLLADQKLVADVLTPFDALDDLGVDEVKQRAEEAARDREAELAAMQREKSELELDLPNVLFAEDRENNVARIAARDAEARRLAAETEEQEEQLRDLFAKRPRAEQELREALEEKNAFIRRRFFLAVFAIAAIYGIPFALGGLLEIPVLRELYQWGAANSSRVHWAVAIGAGLYAGYSVLQYLGSIAARVRAARQAVQRIADQIDGTDKAKNHAHNEELQFEYDIAHRNTMRGVLSRTREAAKKTLDALRVRQRELDELGESFASEAQSASIQSAGLLVSVIDDADVDAWYMRTAPERKLLFLEFFDGCVKRSASRHLPLDELRQRVARYAASAFDDVRDMTMAQAVSGPSAMATETTVAQRLKRLAEYSAPLMEIRDDDIPAQQAMQRDATLWLDSTDATFVALIRRRLYDAELKTPRDPLRVQALSRVLHYPAYAIGQIEYYRAQYDPVKHLESSDLPDLLPTEFVLTGPVRNAYEQVVLGRALGIIRLREDGQLGRVAGDVILGDSHLSAAQRLASSEATLLRELEGEIAPRLGVAQDVERDLRQLLDTLQPISSFDRNVIGALIKRYGSAF